MVSHLQHGMRLRRSIFPAPPCCSPGASPWQVPTAAPQLLPLKNSHCKNLRTSSSAWQGEREDCLKPHFYSISALRALRYSRGIKLVIGNSLALIYKPSMGFLSPYKGHAVSRQATNFSAFPATKTKTKKALTPLASPGNRRAAGTQTECTSVLV